MMTILQYARHAVHFHSLQGSAENSFAFFPCRWRGKLRHPISMFRTVTKNRESKMKQLLKMTAAPAAALFAVALGAMAPSAASAGEYCRTDVTSAMRSCSFDTMEQCQAMSSGRGGSCDRDPFLADTRSAYAYQPKHLHSKSSVRPTK
jgi:hypothetical protein